MPINHSIKNFFLRLLIFFIPFLLFSCTPDSTVVTTGGGTIPIVKSTIVNGQVINNLTSTPIDSADVLISGPSLSISLKTDSLRKFTTKIETETNINLVIQTSKPGFITDTTTATVIPSTTFNLDIIKLFPKTPVVQKSTVNGQVIDNLSGIPIDSADVLISSPSLSIILKTDNHGKFTTEIETETNISLSIFTSKSGFITDTTTAVVVPSTTLNLGLIKLAPITTGTPPSGDPVSIFLASQSTTTIGVRASGSVETASLIFEVRDSSNTSVDLNHSVDVKFKIVAAPGGGEIISPSSVKTNNLGQATVNITSGTKAGVVQIRAQIDLASVTIISDPVSVAIHGGLPDLTHFSVIPSLVNFPALDQFSSMAVSVSVGDKYSNPVKPGTVVSFKTTGGIIEGSIATDDQGGGTVNLISGNPKPVHPTLGPGFATITATTVDENHVTIKNDAIVLFSGIPSVSISPTTFAIANGGSQFFTITVADENGNPLASGTTVAVTADAVNTDFISLQGQVDNILPDTQDPSWTQFSFTLFDAVSATDEPIGVSITIKVTGPNGIAEKTISGTSR